MNLLPKDYTKQEDLIALALDEFGIRYDQQYMIRPYTLDFYLPEIKMCIEADGIYGHSRKRDVKRDLALIQTTKIEYILRVKHTKYLEIKETIWQALNNLEQVPNQKNPEKPLSRGLRTKIDGSLKV
jgi:very-short-patch-repair endonuclease